MEDLAYFVLIIALKTLSGHWDQSSGDVCFPLICLKIDFACDIIFFDTKSFVYNQNERTIC